MTPATQAGMWLIQFISFLSIFSIIYIAFPFEYFFDVYSDKVGFITETSWSNIVLFVILAVSVLVNAGLIFITATARMKG
ncbi:TPA: hypothetical protein ACJIWU_002324 [Enterobacter chengduensis]|uniref:Uncharacterized protein n=1 Tax=Enterobacter chengduensis TaxID=2494701 RepID=A0AAW3HD09_9ENTR|nr:hypothetical protein [Enterobacter chengduensis]OTW32479.1 hypothetical protein CAP57_24055 [Enterobacter kobei]KJX33475.1 hypothetical protein SG71_18770 [Enterobacter chengduensis]MBN9878171.1 hypothetical protein [Enterobacter chengduensis]MBT1936116.1 hypothetical protein [Enterobacter chengduensis]MBT1964499.1 hypothetical protein [Enterobacter chengduensis]